jgi:ParB family chromosome partitioning protein
MNSRALPDSFALAHPTLIRMRVDAIRISDERIRRDMGDIKGLAQNIAIVGLLQPIVVTADGLLVAGARRLAAVKELGWTEIPAVLMVWQ